MQITWLPLALDRANEIAQHIALDKPKAAQNWVETLFDKIEVLKEFPEIGRVKPEVNRKEIRELIYGNYRIFYKLKNPKIEILTIRSAYQKFPEEQF